MVKGRGCGVAGEKLGALGDPGGLSLVSPLWWWAGEKGKWLLPISWSQGVPRRGLPGRTGAWVLLAGSGCVPPLQTPTLIVYGDQDTELGQVSLNNLQHLPEHRVLVLRGAGHACYLDRPDEWHRELLAFLQQLE